MANLLSTVLSGNNHITLGPNSTWASYLRVGGNGHSVSGNEYASVVTTNGNLHLDAGTSRAIYLNYYAGTAGVAFGNGASGIAAWMGSDGDLWRGGSDNTGTQYVYNSGTWAINVTGNAATATTAGSASTAGSAGSVDGLTINNSGAPINPNNVTQNQIGYNDSVALFGQTDGGLYSSAYNSSWIHQIFGDFRTGQIAIRGKNSGTFGDWRIVVDDKNIGSYAVPYGNMTSSTGLNDNKLYLRTNGDNNHYLWNAADDWEEMVYYNGTGFRVKGSTGTVPAYFTEAGVYASAYRGKDNVGGTGEASWHPAGIYSGGTQWLYGTTNRNNASTLNQGQMYFDGNYGYGMVGLYASTRYQAIFAMGDAYKLPVDGTTTGSLYGLAWSHPNAGGVAGNLNTHGLLVMENGTFLAAISGSIRSRDDMRAPIFYDSANTAYYVDPASTGTSLNIAGGIVTTAPGGSVLLKHAVSEVDAWLFQENAANWGLYWKNNPSGNHTFGGYTTVGAELFGMSAANVSGNGVLTTNFVGATAAYAQYMLSNFTGYIWSASTIFAAGDMRAPIFYDSADTGYYLDPNGTSNLLKLSTQTMAFNGMNPMSANSPYVDRYNGSVGYRNGTMGIGNTDFNTIFSNWGSGFIDTWSSPANAPGGSTHYIGLQSIHYSELNSNTIYGFQMACAGEADNRFFWRASWPSKRAWVEMIHSGNFTTWAQEKENQRLSTGNSPTFVDIYANEWFRNNNVNEGLYNQATGTHFYSHSGQGWTVTGSGGTIELQFRSNNQSTLRGYVYADTNNNIGFLTNGGGWSLRTNSSANVFVHGPELTINADGASSSNIIMNDGDHGPRTIHCNSNRIGFLNQAGAWGSWCDDDGSWRNETAMYSPIFYDSNDTNYYLDPNSTGKSLNIAGNIDLIARSASWAEGIRVRVPSTSSWGGIRFTRDRGNDDGNWAIGYTGINASDDLTFWCNNAGDGGTMKLQMDKAGNSTFQTSVISPLFLVNNHSDNTKGYRIHNTSGTSVSAMFVNSSNQLVIAAGAVDQINLNKKVLVNAVALGVNIAPSATAGRIDASNDIVAFSSSDERLKENITPIANALDKVKSLTGVEFDWKPEHKEAHGHEGRDTGIIAQQVLAVMPTAVRTNDTGFLAVRYEKLIGLLIEGMKEQQEQIEELKAKLDGLTK